MSERRLKVFISAYACEPHKGSEPGIGWNVVNELSRYHEVHVLTRANNREAIEAALHGKTENIPEFHYYDLPKWLSFWKKKRRGYRFYYYLWQYGAFFHYRKWVNSSGFDIVQHLTFANIAMPSLFMLCRGITVYGPIGFVKIPAGVKKALPTRIRIAEFLRQFTMRLMIHFEPARVLTTACADHLIEYAENPHPCFSRRYRHKVLRHSQTGINPDEPEYRLPDRRDAENQPVRLLICSEFMYWKGCIWAALASVVLLTRHRNVVLDIYGSGAEEGNIRKILSDPAISDRVHWHGFVSKAELLQALNRADIFLYPSYHHGLATVILQAMYCRLPVIALQGDPISETIAMGCGLTAAGIGRDAIVKDIVAQAEKLIRDPELRHRLGNRGHELIEQRYDWRVLVKELSNLYQTMWAKKEKSQCR